MCVCRCVEAVYQNGSHPLVAVALLDRRWRFAHVRRSSNAYELRLFLTLLLHFSSSNLCRQAEKPKRQIQAFFRIREARDNLEVCVRLPGPVFAAFCDEIRVTKVRETKFACTILPTGACTYTCSTWLFVCQRFSSRDNSSEPARSSGTVPFRIDALSVSRLGCR